MSPDEEHNAIQKLAELPEAHAFHIGWFAQRLVSETWVRLTAPYSSGTPSWEELEREVFRLGHLVHAWYVARKVPMPDEPIERLKDLARTLCPEGLVTTREVLDGPEAPDDPRHGPLGWSRGDGEYHPELFRLKNSLSGRLLEAYRSVEQILRGLPAERNSSPVLDAGVVLARYTLSVWPTRGAAQDRIPDYIGVLVTLAVLRRQGQSKGHEQGQAILEANGPRKQFETLCGLPGLVAEQNRVTPLPPRSIIDHLPREWTALILDEEKHVAWLRGIEKKLTPRQFEVVQCLCGHHPEPVPNKSLPGNQASARRSLDNLCKKDPDWDKLIVRAGKPHQGNRLNLPDDAS
jgi:hypothetical protein